MKSITITVEDDETTNSTSYYFPNISNLVSDTKAGGLVFLTFKYAPVPDANEALWPEWEENPDDLG